MRFAKRSALLLWVVLQLALVCAWSDEVAAQAPQGASEAPTEDAAESRSAAFQAVEGASAEQVPGGPLLIAAYGVILVLLVAYVARLGSLHTKNQVELERLTRALEAARKS
jgi:hypothetical protein